MKVVILAGGFGTRLSEETEIKPKPMVEIGGRPILWHIMKTYAHHGHADFYIALGYKGDVIKRYFLERAQLAGDLSIRMGSGAVSVRRAETDDDWQVNLVDTGLTTGTGGRVRRLAQWLGRETFMLTYGDGVCDVDINDLVAFHKRSGALATLTAVRPPARFGALVFDEGESKVTKFSEKPQAGEGWINGGFMVLEPQIFDYLSSDADSIELNGLEPLATKGLLAAYKHDRFWQCMDTLRDVRLLESLWQGGSPPWRVWGSP